MLVHPCVRGVICRTFREPMRPCGPAIFIHICFKHHSKGLRVANGCNLQENSSLETFLVCYLDPYLHFTLDKSILKR